MGLTYSTVFRGVKHAAVLRAVCVLRRNFRLGLWRGRHGSRRRWLHAGHDSRWLRLQSRLRRWLRLLRRHWHALHGLRLASLRAVSPWWRHAATRAPALPRLHMASRVNASRHFGDCAGGSGCGLALFLQAFSAKPWQRRRTRHGRHRGWHASCAKGTAGGCGRLGTKPGKGPAGGTAGSTGAVVPACWVCMQCGQAEAAFAKF